MANNGGTDITRDISDINKALNQLNVEVKSVSAQANNLTKAFKLNPFSTELLTKSMATLEDEIEKTTKQLNLLMQKQADFDKANVDKTSKEYLDLEKQISKVTLNLEKAKYSYSEFVDNSNGDKLKEDLDSYEDSFEKISSSVSKLASNLKSVFSKILDISKEYASSADEIQTKIDKFGGTAEEWQLNSNAWDKVTGSANAYSSVLDKVNVSLSKIQKDSSEIGGVLAQLGLSFDDLKGKTATEALDIYLNALKNIGDESTRQALAIALLGDETGVFAAQMAGTSSSAIAEYNKEMKQAGLLTNEQVAAGAELQDTFDYLQQTIKTVVASLGSSFKPLIESLAILIQNLAPILNGVVTVLSRLGPIGTNILAVIISLIGVLPTLITMMAALNFSKGQVGLAIGTLALLGIATGTTLGILASASQNASVSYQTPIQGSFDSQAYNQFTSGLNNIESRNSSMSSYSGAMNSSTTNNYYYDNSTMNNSISKDVDYEEMIDYINDKKRTQIGG